MDNEAVRCNRIPVWRVPKVPKRNVKWFTASMRTVIGIYCGIHNHYPFHSYQKIHQRSGIIWMSHYNFAAACIPPRFGCWLVGEYPFVLINGHPKLWWSKMKEFFHSNKWQKETGSRRGTETKVPQSVIYAGEGQGLNCGPAWKPETWPNANQQNMTVWSGAHIRFGDNVMLTWTMGDRWMSFYHLLPTYWGRLSLSACVWK